MQSILRAILTLAVDNADLRATLVSNIARIKSLEIYIFAVLRSMRAVFSGFSAGRRMSGIPLRETHRRAGSRTFFKAASKAVTAVELVLMPPGPTPVCKRSKRLLSCHRNGSMYKGGSVFERRSERNPGVLGKYVG